MQTILDGNLMGRAADVFSGVQDVAKPYVESVRGRGCLVGLDFGRPCAPVVTALREHGVLSGGSEDPHVMRLMPPLITSDAELECFADAFEMALMSLE